MNMQALFPRINCTPFKVYVIGGVRRELRVPLNIYQTEIREIFVHTYAKITLCKLRRKASLEEPKLPRMVSHKPAATK